MATTPQRTDLDFEEFRKRLLQERSHVLKLRHNQHTDMLAESQDASDNERDVISPDENENSAAALADRERDEAQDENERSLLHQIEAALTRLDEGTYGLDEVTGEPIPVARLRAIPWANMTIESAERYE